MVPQELVSKTRRQPEDEKKLVLTALSKNVIEWELEDKAEKKMVPWELEDSLEMKKTGIKN